jgi:predicted Rossmann fold nucleotide-binding protein DprA/Smf involved in DNA uptake
LKGNVVRGSEVCEIRAPSNLKSFFHGKPPSLWCRDDLTILDRTLLGIISARQIDSDLTSESSQLLKQLVFMKDVSFVGGWHSPLEEEALQGQALLLTHCSPKAKRITRDASMRRNQLVVELAKALLILSAPEGSASLNLARSALRQGKTVHTLEHRLNKDLLIAGAVPATLDTIKEALQ